jgi:uncharacterized protein (DUF433 family)
VALILDFLAGGWTNAEILENLPGLEHNDIRECIAYAAENDAKAVRGSRTNDCFGTVTYRDTR